MDSSPLAHAGLPALPAPARTTVLPPRGRLRPSGTLAREDRLGAVFFASIVWVFFDLGRPYPIPFLPLAVTAVMFVDWALKKEKQLGPQWIWWFVLWGVIAAGIPLAANNYWAAFYTRLMGILFVGICLPLQGLLTSLRRLRWWLCTLIFIAFFVGAWATTHGGWGPARGAGQDENYVAALMTVGAALSYFAFFTNKRLWFRLVLGMAMFSFLGAMARAENPSRGGFLALVAVGLYCLWRSPKKVMGLSIVGVVSVGMLLFAGDAFWQEIDTSADYKDGTGDMRLEVWQAGLRMWKANPVLGVGAGNLQWVIGDYESPAQFEKFGRNLTGSIIAHSSHVEMLAETGSLGALSMIVLTWSTWAGLGKIRPRKRQPGEPPPHPDLVELGHYADAVRCAILAVLVNGTFLSMFYYSHLWVLLAVGTAMPYIHRRILQREAALAPNAPSRAIVTNNTIALQKRPLGRGRGLSPRRQA